MREKVLNLLAAQHGEYISGETISNSLQMTRAAVWKQIEALRRAGFNIEAKTKRGYRLVGVPLDLDPWVFQQELRTRKLGRECYIFDELSSTIDWAKEAARKECRHGLTVIAREQKMSRGRLQRPWISPKGGLWLTVILTPNLTLADAAKLTLCAGVAAAEAVELCCGLKLGIKWPNDLVFQGRKVAGILAETVGEWTSLKTLIMSIGINVNVAPEQFAAILSATSIAAILGRPVSLNELAARVLEYLEIEFETMENSGFEPIRQRWLSRAVGIGQPVIILRGEQEFRGVMLGLNDDGSIMIRTEDGDVAFVAGEIKLRSETGGYF
jgi:BirA family biotin operon repressor/biotin-[acetyl-CoA-carboxylase] ligase